MVTAMTSSPVWFETAMSLPDRVPPSGKSIGDWNSVRSRLSYATEDASRRLRLQGGAAVREELDLGVARAGLGCDHAQIAEARRSRRAFGPVHAIARRPDGEHAAAGTHRDIRRLTRADHDGCPEGRGARRLDGGPHGRPIRPDGCGGSVSAGVRLHRDRALRRGDRYGRRGDPARRARARRDRVPTPRQRSR